MSQEFVLRFVSTLTKLLLLASMAGLPTSAQLTMNETSPSSNDAVNATLPDAPSSQNTNGISIQSDTAASSATQAYEGPIGPIPPLLTKTPLTLRNRFTVYAHQAFGRPH